MAPVLILGETGTGKTLLARTMHSASVRMDSPFVAINCAAIPDSLLETEVFGHERGAFTDAHHAKPGLFQAAHQGTLFLDEIGAMALGLQAKLLTAIEDRAVRRVGGTRSEPVDVWILSATSEDLSQASRERRFREDLYHRLAAVTLRLPSLRERHGDIVALAEHFLSRFCREYELPPKRLADDAKQALQSYPWPGNVRELANVMERIALLTERVSVTAADLSLPSYGVNLSPTFKTDLPGRPSALLRASVGDFEREQLLSALWAAEGNLSRAASILGIPRNTLRYRLEKHGLRSAAALRSDPQEAGRRLRDDSGPRRDRASDSLSAHGRQGMGFLWVRVVDADAITPSANALELVTSLLQKAAAFGGTPEQLDGLTTLITFGFRDMVEPTARAMQAFVACRQTASTLDRTVSLQGIIHFAECEVVGREPWGISDTDRTRVLAEIHRLAVDIGHSALIVTEDAVPFLERELGPTARRTASPPPGEEARAKAVRLETPPSRPSIAVLPFRNLSDQPDETYFSDGITDDIITGLSRLHWLFVIARYSTLVYRETPTSVRRIREDLGVRYLLEGTVRRSADRLRVTACLADADAGNAIWSERYEGSAADLFTFQDTITNRVVGSLDTRIRLHEETLALQRRGESLDAYDYILRALHCFYRSSREDFFKAGELLEQAVRLDETSARAWAWRAWWFNRLIGQGWSARPRDDGQRAIELAETALEWDRDDPFALAVAGHLAAFLSRGYAGALRRFERSLEINPGSAFTWGISAATFCYIGEPKTALERVAYALKLSPFDPLNFSFMGLAGFAEMLRGNYEEGVTWAQRSRRENPAFSANLRVLTACLAHLDRIDEARQVAREFLAIESNFRLGDFVRQYPLADAKHLQSYVTALRNAGLPD